MNRINRHARVLLAIFICFIGVSKSYSQKTDYNWLMGYGSSIPSYDSTCQCAFGITQFNFNQTPASVTYDSLEINFYFTNSSASDSNGNLLFYSNGVQVGNTANEIMQNSDSLGFGPLYSLNISTFNYGSYFQQGLLILPNPLLNNTYDLFYPYIDTFDDGNILPDKILRARVDMNANGGLGAVTQKDVVVWEGDNDFTICAVKHGNGRDWWICTNQTSGNCHVMLLYTGSDTIFSALQCSGAISPWGDSHACRFSPDGNYYITTNDSGQVSIFNFDRCAGTLTLNEEFTMPEISQSNGWLPSGVEFSADSRFFYVFCSEFVMQYDLTANPVVNSRDTISVYTYPTTHSPADYFWGQLAPDGKIYISGGSGSYYISEIDSPVNKGNACAFLDQSVHLPSFIEGLPYYPNYRLGSLTSSQCDSLSTATQDVRNAKEQILKVFPNPANDVATVDYGFTDWNKGQPDLEICNALGQTVYTQVLPMYSGFQKIDVSRFAAGVYTVFIKRNNGVVATQKLVKE